MKGHVYKRGESWTYVVDIGRDKGTGKRLQKSKGGFSKKKEAESALRKVLTQLDNNSYVESSKEPFSNFISEWFYKHYQKRLKETTKSSREYMMKKHLLENNPFSQKPLSLITVEDIDLFYNLKLDENCSTNYIRKMHQMLYQAFSQAVKWKKVEHNPVSESDPPKVIKEEMNIWSINEIHTFLNSCKNERSYIAFFLAIYTGMRKGELLALKWNDIDFTKKVVYVKRTVSHIPSMGYVTTTPKTKNSVRQIPISDEVIRELLLHKSNQNKDKTILKDAYQDQDLVISTELGKVQDPRNLLRTMKRLISISGVTSIRFHDIRHTHASILISSGIDVVKVSARLGHANPKITLEIYAHLLPNIQNDVADIFQETLNKHQC